MSHPHSSRHNPALESDFSPNCKRACPGLPHWKRLPFPNLSPPVPPGLHKKWQCHCGGTTSLPIMAAGAVCRKWIWVAATCTPSQRRSSPNSLHDPWVKTEKTRKMGTEDKGGPMLLPESQRECLSAWPVTFLGSPDKVSDSYHSREGWSLYLEIKSSWPWPRLAWVKVVSLTPTVNNKFACKAC